MAVEPSSTSFSDDGGDDDGVLGGAEGEFLVLGGSRVISKQPHLMCVHRLRRIPAITPTTADAHAPMMSVRSVALYGIDGGGVVSSVAIFVYVFFFLRFTGKSVNQCPHYLRQKRHYFGTRAR